jgi:hypothetical protein
MVILLYVCLVFNARFQQFSSHLQMDSLHNHRYWVVPILNTNPRKKLPTFSLVLKVVIIVGFEPPQLIEKLQFTSLTL